ncbi:MAG: M56 family metallopeptidase [Candidatus Aquicultorales bacterium]
MINFLVNNLVSSFYSAFVSLAGVYLICRIARIWDPRLQYLLLFAPLLKPILVLIDTPVFRGSNAHGPFFIAGRIHDPLGIIQIEALPNAGVFFVDEAAAVVSTVVVLSVFALMIFRWRQLLIVRNRLAHSLELKPAEAPELFSILEALSKKTGIALPAIILSEAGLAPFTIGMIKTKIVLSRELLDRFTGKRLEVILAHELAHMKRLDAMTRWFSLILRDVQFFNPGVKLAHRHLELQRELSCDLLAADWAGVSASFVGEVLFDMVLLNKQMLEEQGGVQPALVRFGGSYSTVSRFAVFGLHPLARRIELLRTKNMALATISCWDWALTALCCLAVVWIQIGFFIQISGYTFFIR